MAANVQYKRPEPYESQVVVSAPGRGRLARELGALANYVRGKGMQVVPAHRPGIYLSSTTPVSAYFRTEPSGFAIARLWVVVAHQEEITGGIVGAELQLTFPNATTAIFAPDVLTGLATLAPRFFIEELSAKSYAQEDFAIEFQRKSGTSAVTIESLACFEMPRAVLALDSVDEGVDLETVRSGQAIYDGANESLGAVAESLSNSWARRTLFAQSFPELEVDSGSWTDLFTLAPTVVPHKTGRADTELVCRWDVRVRAGDGSTGGEVRITSGVDGNTDTLTLAVGATSDAWLGPGSITLRCEDVDTIDGLPGSSTWETVQVAVRRTAGTAPIYVTATAVWEPRELPLRIRITRSGAIRQTRSGAIRVLR